MCFKDKQPDQMNIRGHPNIAECDKNAFLGFTQGTKKILAI